MMFNNLKKALNLFLRPNTKTEEFPDGKKIKILMIKKCNTVLNATSFL
jgi:hypothetical protein